MIVYYLVLQNSFEKKGEESSARRRKKTQLPITSRAPARPLLALGWNPYRNPMISSEERHDDPPTKTKAGGPGAVSFWGGHVPISLFDHMLPGHVFSISHL